MASFSLRYCGIILCAVLCVPFIARAADPTQPNSQAADPLVQILVSKGVLTPAEAGTLAPVPVDAQRAQLLTLLRNKGVLTALDYDSLTVPSASSQVSPALVASTTPMVPSGAVPCSLVPNHREGETFSPSGQ